MPVAVLCWDQGAQAPLNLAPPIFRVITVHKLLNTGQLDTVVLLVVASQMMRGQPPPQYFFPEPLLVYASAMFFEYAIAYDFLSDLT